MKLQSTAAEVSYRKGIHYIGVKPIIDFVSEKKNVLLVGILVLFCFLGGWVI